MKNLVAVLVLVLSGFSTYAFEEKAYTNDELNSIKIQVENGDEEKSLHFVFSSKEEMKNFDISPYLNNLVPAQSNEDFCTADLTVTVRIGGVIGFVQFEVKLKDIPCEDIIAKAKEFRDALNNL